MVIAAAARVRPPSRGRVSSSPATRAIRRRSPALAAAAGHRRRRTSLVGRLPHDEFALALQRLRRLHLGALGGRHGRQPAGGHGLRLRDHRLAACPRPASGSATASPAWWCAPRDVGRLADGHAALRRRPGAAAAPAARRPWPSPGSRRVSTPTWSTSTASSRRLAGRRPAGRTRSACQPGRRRGRPRARDPVGGDPHPATRARCCAGPWRRCASQDAGAGPAWEIVVVDDGSQRRHRRRSWPRWPGAAGRRLRVVDAAGATWGGPRARNLGARAARGRWLLFLDDDIVAPPGLLAAHLDAAGGHPGRRHHRLRVTDRALVDAPHFHYLDTRGVARLRGGAGAGTLLRHPERGRAPGGVPGRGRLRRALLRPTDSRTWRWPSAWRTGPGSGSRCLPAPVPRPRPPPHPGPVPGQEGANAGASRCRHLARLHPDRLREMRLHHALDQPGGRRPRGGHPPAADSCRRAVGRGAAPPAGELARVVRTIGRGLAASAPPPAEPGRCWRRSARACRDPARRLTEWRQ